MSSVYDAAAPKKPTNLTVNSDLLKHKNHRAYRQILLMPAGRSDHCRRNHRRNKLHFTVRLQVLSRFYKASAPVTVNF